MQIEEKEISLGVFSATLTLWEDGTLCMDVKRDGKQVVYIEAEAGGESADGDTETPTQ